RNSLECFFFFFFFFFQAEDGIRDYKVTGVQTCALPIWATYILAALARGCRPWLPTVAPPGLGGLLLRLLGKFLVQFADAQTLGRSEERRVGKECRGRGSGDRDKKKVRKSEMRQ